MLAIILYVVLAVALWKTFEKMGEDGWKGIIPFYNYYVLFDVLWEVKAFLKYIISTIVAGILMGVGATMMTTFVIISAYSGGGMGGAAAGVILLIVSIILMIYAEIIWIRLMYRVSLAFGHGIGFTVGLVFVPFIMFLILGFGSSSFHDPRGDSGHFGPQGGNGSGYQGNNQGYQNMGYQGTQGNQGYGNPVNQNHGPQDAPYPGQMNGQQNSQVYRNPHYETDETFRNMQEQDIQYRQQQQVLQQNMQQNMAQGQQPGTDMGTPGQY